MKIMDIVEEASNSNSSAFYSKYGITNNIDNKDVKSVLTTNDKYINKAITFFDKYNNNFVCRIRAKTKAEKRIKTILFLSFTYEICDVLKFKKVDDTTINEITSKLIEYYIPVKERTNLDYSIYNVNIDKSKIFAIDKFTKSLSKFDFVVRKSDSEYINDVSEFESNTSHINDKTFKSIENALNDNDISYPSKLISDIKTQLKNRPFCIVDLGLTLLMDDSDQSDIDPQNHTEGTFEVYVSGTLEINVGNDEMILNLDVSGEIDNSSEFELNDKIDLNGDLVDDEVFDETIISSQIEGYEFNTLTQSEIKEMTEINDEL